GHETIVEYLEDADGDGFGGAIVATGCEGEDHPGTLTTGGDCDDGNRRVNPLSEWITDGDGDGFGDRVSAVTIACEPGAGLGLRGGACDAGAADVFPGAMDPSCGDGASPSCAPDVVCHPPLAGEIAALAPDSALGFTGDVATALAGGVDVDADGFPDALIG